MKKGLLIYKDCDYEINRGFAQRFLDNCLKYGIKIDLALESGLKYGIKDAEFYGEYRGINISGYDFAINRSRNAYIAQVLEKLGLRVFNSAYVTALCNDKNLAYLHAAKLGIPCLDTYIYSKSAAQSAAVEYPVIVKKPFSHGGSAVYLCNDKEEFNNAVNNIYGEYITLQQKLSGGAVNDIRVYVMGNKVLGAVMRTATQGFKANYCKGGAIRLYELDKTLSGYVDIITANGYYDFAGIDFLYNGGYYFNEIEDAVGSRSLCTLKNIDTSKMYLEYISGGLNK